MLTVPLEGARAEIVVHNSRFIASLEGVDSVSAARAFIVRIKAEFPDATHNVPAFIVGGERSATEFCSDDGEPSGTSGRPLLATLRGSGLGNAAIVVTRYFGGSLLGTGGLVKAYSEAGKAVLALTRRAVLVELTRIELELPYGLLERERILASSLGATTIEEIFAESVRAVLDIPSAAMGEFSSKLSGISAGALKPVILGTSLGKKPS